MLALLLMLVLLVAAACAAAAAPSAMADDEISNEAIFTNKKTKPGFQRCWKFSQNPPLFSNPGNLFFVLYSLLSPRDQVLTISARDYSQGWDACMS